jgi:hypothetical protein
MCFIESYMFRQNIDSHHFKNTVIKKQVKDAIYKTSRHAVAQLVEALHYKPEGRGFDSRCCIIATPSSLASHLIRFSSVHT